jgi:iron complex transport system substrate-binding protein
VRHLALSIPLLALVLACDRGPRTSTARLPEVHGKEHPLRVALPDGSELVVPAPPRRILCANAAWVDFVTLLVGPERLVALPAEAFGYSRLTGQERRWEAVARLPVFDAERALALAPDLVLGHAWQKPETFVALRRAGVPTLAIAVPHTWDDVVATLDLLGTILGERTRVRELQTGLETRRAALLERARPYAGLRVLSYTNLGAGGWTAGSGTTADVLIALAGLRNAAGEAGLVGDVTAPRERLIAIAPDVFLVGRPDRSESSPPSADFLLGDPDLRELEAIRERRIVALPPALFTALSPELLAGAEALLEGVERLMPR